jgi:hypothetical protein
MEEAELAEWETLHHLFRHFHLLLQATALRVWVVREDFPAVVAEAEEEGAVEPGNNEKGKRNLDIFGNIFFCGSHLFACKKLGFY